MSRFFRTFAEGNEQDTTNIPMFGTVYGHRYARTDCASGSGTGRCV